MTFKPLQAAGRKGMGMKSLQFRMMLLLLFAGVLLLSVVSVAGAAPSLVGLTSPTHPDENIWYSGNDPVFTWIRDLGHVGHSSTAGNPGGVAVLSHYAYKADGASGLKIIDISNPASPVLTGSLDTTGSATDIAVSGNYAYIADGASGLKIIDISNPASPVLTGSFDMIGYVSATGIAVSGNNAYIAYGASGLQIIDISDPANPVLTGSLDTIGSATDIAVTGNYAYIADGVSGLQIINISNPASPVLTGSRDTTGSATSIAVSGNYAYIADGVSGLQIINISDPASPLIASTFDTTDNANGVAFRGSRVYLTYSQEQYGYRNNPYPPFGGFVFLGILEGLAEIDVSDPAAPRTVGSSYHEYGWQHVSGVALDGNYTYVAGSELEVFDIGPAQYSCALDHSPSTSPDTIAESADNSTSYNNLPDGEYYFHVAAVEGASLGPVSHRRVRIDSSCNSRPLLNIENPNPYWASYSDYSARILSVGYSMFNDGTSGAFNISIAGVSTSDGAEWCGTSSCDEPLSIVGSFPIANAERVEVDGSNAYVAASTDGLKIIDISDPANPVMAGSYDTPEYAEDMVLDGSYAYVADWNSLQIIDVSDPASPVRAGSFSTPPYFRDVAVSAQYAYLGSSSNGLEVINVADPTRPAYAGSYPINVNGITVSGQYAYIAGSAAGLQIYDVTNPAGLTLVGSYDSPGSAAGVAVSGGYAYIADGASGLQVVDISDPANPMLVGTYDTPGNAYNVTVSGNHVRIADGYQGLQIIDISNPAAPVLAGSYDTPGSVWDVAVSGGFTYIADYYSFPDGALRIVSGVSGLPHFPLAAGNLAPGESYPFTMRYRVPQGVASFRTQFNGRADTVCGNSYTYGTD